MSERDPKKLAKAGVERDLIACLMKNEEAFLEASDLQVSDFVDPLNRALFIAIDHLYKSGGRPDPVTVTNVLPLTMREELDKRDGWQYLGALTEMPIDPRNAVMLSHELQDLTLRRRMVDALEESLDLVYQPMHPEKLVNAVDGKLMTATDRTGVVVDLLGSGAMEYAEERAQNPTEMPGIPTGFPILDKHLQGLQPGRLYAIAARLKVGKSLALANIAKHIAVDQGLPILFLSTEHPKQDERARFQSLISGVPELRIHNGTYVMNPMEADKVFEASKKLEAAPIHFAYVPQFSVATIRKIVKKYVRLHGVKVVFFDYLKVAESTQNMKEHQELGNLTTGLKDLAGMENVPIVTAAQMNRESTWSMRNAKGEAKDIGIDGIADSDRIARYATVVMILRRLSPEEMEKLPQFGNSDLRLLEVAVNRHGPANYKQIMKVTGPILKIEETGSSVD